MYDPHTRESRGFGFVTMESAEEADAAIIALNTTDLMGKTMTVTKVSSITFKFILVIKHHPGSSWTRQDSDPWQILRSSKAS